MDGLLTFLGTGTSMGVPTLGCGCAVCTSADPRDRRLRPSVLLRWREQAGGRERVVVIDTGPDFREQALRNGLTRVDAVFYTHSHADHILGMDDLRPLSFTVYREGGPIPLYATPETAEVLERIYDYTFSPRATYPNRAGSNCGRWPSALRFTASSFCACRLLHGEMEIAGFRFGRAAYLTDVSAIPESSFALLKGWTTWSSPRCATSRTPATPPWSRPSAGRRRIGARHTWLTHIAHELGHEETNRMLPDGIRLAYDGLSLPVNLRNLSSAEELGLK
jgi:phosphoribosyl 1,2-cyclic phosphate phosphodiesterase